MHRVFIVIAFFLVSIVSNSVAAIDCPECDFNRPEKPKSLSVPATDADGSFTITWSNAVGFDSTGYYRLFRVISENGGYTKTIAEVPPTVTSYTVNSFADGTYNFYIQACNTGEADLMLCSTSTASGDIIVRNKPAKPTAPSSLNSLSTNYSISWTKPSGKVTFYNLQEKVNGGNWTTILSNSTLTSVGFNGKSNNANYEYRVQACNSYSWACSDYSSPGSVKVRLKPATPPAPTNINATDTAYTLIWSKPSGTVTYYTVQERVVGGGWSNLVTSHTSTSLVRSGRSNNTDYEYRVQACNGYSWACSNFSEVNSVKVRLKPATPEVPRGPSTNTTGHATVEWAKPAGTVTYYDLQMRKNNGGSWLTAGSGITSTSKNITDLVDGVWDFQVRACNQYAWACSSYSGVSQDTVVRHTPGMPGVPTVPSTSTGSASVSWSAVNGATYYDMQKRKNGGSWETAKSGVTTSSETVTGLTDGSWDYRVRACNGYGWSCSSYSADSSDTTVRLIPSAPGTPSVPSTDTDGSYSVSWAKPAGTVTYYDVIELDTNYPRPKGVGHTNALSVSINSRSSGDYYYKVKACNEYPWACSEYSGPSATIRVRHIPAVPAVSGPSISYKNHFTLSWPSDRNASYFLVERRISGDNWRELESRMEGSSLSITEEADGHYDYRVNACNELNCSGFSQLHRVTVNLVTEGYESSGDATKTLADIDDAAFNNGYTPVSDVVAVIPGTAAVQGGIARYSIPIELPPGRRDLQPSVSLNYSSRNGNGLVGQGWSLAAGGSIHRCAGIWDLDQSGAKNAIYSAEDNLCLNGERLILASGQHGESGAIYYPENDLTTKVVQSGAIQQSTSRFTVYYANGRKAYFGENDSSRDLSSANVVRSWHIARELDPFSNNILYDYFKEDGALYLDHIDYTGRGSTAGNRRISFDYGHRPDLSAGYEANDLVKRFRRLESISTFVGQDSVATYELVYGENSEPYELTHLNLAQRKSFLTQIRLSRNGEEARATNIDWSPMPGLLADIGSNPWLSLPSDKHKIFSHADYDGDGLHDLLTVTDPNSGVQLTAKVYLSKTKSWIDVTQLSLVDPYYFARGFLRGLSADFTGDGRAEILGYKKMVNQGIATIYLAYANWNGTRFEVTETNINITCNERDLRIDSASGVTRYKACNSFVADINGDGLDDFIASRTHEDHFHIEQTYYLRDPGCDSGTSGDTCAYGFRRDRSELVWGNDVKLVDIDGDGREEFGGAETNYLDLNGDGLLDILHQTSVKFNQGGGVYTSINHNAPIPDTRYYEDPIARDEWGDRVEFAISPEDYVRSIDLDNDGLEDLVVPSQVVYEAPANRYCMFSQCNKEEKLTGDLWQWHIWLARIDTAGKPVYVKQTHGPTLYGALAELKVLDIDGDGKRDILSHIRPQYNQGGAPAPGVHVYFSRVGNTDLVVSIDDGVKQHQFQYGNLSEGKSLYQVDYELPQQAPYIHFNNGLAVVKTYTTDDGVGGTRSLNYRYESARFHKAGRGFQGFKAIEVSDKRKGIKTRSEFAQLFPFTGSLLRMDVRAIDGNKLLSETDNTLAVKLRHKGSGAVSERLFSAGELTDAQMRDNIKLPFIKTEISSRYQLDGVTRVSESVTHSRYDGYSNLTERTVTKTDDGWLTLTAKTRSGYSAPNTGDWRISKLDAVIEQSEIYYNDSLGVNAGDIRRVKARQLTYNSSNDYRLDAVEDCMPGYDSQPVANICSSGSGLTLKQIFDHDSYGNPTKITTTSRNTNAGKTDIDGTRWASTQYTDDGYFARTTKNSLWGENKIAREQMVDAKTGLVTETRDANGLKTIKDYNAYGLPVAVHYQNASGGLYAPSRYWQYHWCDSAGSDCPAHAVSRVITTQVGSPETIEYKDTLDRVIKKEVKTLVAAGSAANYAYQVWENTYDALGHLTAEIHYSDNDLSKVAETTYSDFDILDRPTYKTVSYKPVDYQVSYDYRGLTTDMTVVGDKTLTMSFTKASDGWMLENTDANGYTTQFRYDSLGNPVLIRDVAGSDTLASYNSFGHKLTMADPNRGAWSFSSNALGELKWQKDANGNTLHYGYDALGRLISRVPSQGDTSYWRYDPTQNGTKYYGLLGEENRGRFKRSFTLDAIGRVINTVTDTDGKMFTDQVKYDSHYNRVSGRLLDDGSLIQSHYDSETGVLFAETDVRRGRVMYQIAAFDGAGAAQTISYGNGLTTEISRYFSGQVTEICTTSGTDCGISDDAVAQHLVYQNQRGTDYDAFGNLLGMQDLKGDYWEDYSYDDLHRLTASVRSIHGGNASTYHYEYDAAGNLTRKSDYGSAYQYGNREKSAGGNAGPNAVRRLNKIDGTAVNFSYDNNGNMTSGDGSELNYDLNNKPTSITKGGVTTVFYYDVNGERYKQVETREGVTTTTYYGNSAEYVVKGNKAESRTYLGDWGIRTLDSQGRSQLRFVHRDRLGSVHTLTSATIDASVVGGDVAVVERRAFDAFGSVIDDGEENLAGEFKVTSRGFTGHEHLQGVGIIHMNGRAYDPSLGRFLSVDPFIQSPENSQSLNPYSYIMNNPLVGVDPSGYVSSEVGRDGREPSPSPLNTIITDCGGNNSCGGQIDVGQISDVHLLVQWSNGGDDGLDSTASGSPDELVSRTNVDNTGNNGYYNSGETLSRIINSGLRDHNSSNELLGSMWQGSTQKKQQPLNSQELLDRITEVEKLGYLDPGTADYIYKNNVDPNLIITVDASRLVIKQLGNFALNPRTGNIDAVGKAVGLSNYAVHGQVTLRDRGNGTFGIYQGLYDFEWHDMDSFKDFTRNIGNIGGVIMHFDGGTSYSIRYSGNANVIRK